MSNTPPATPEAVTAKTPLPTAHVISGFRHASLDSLLAHAATNRPVCPWYAYRDATGTIKRAPYVGGWYKATTDEAITRAWHARRPDAIWGDFSPFDVIVDIDKKHAKDGDRALANLVTPITITAADGGIVTQTASGGRHHRFLNPEHLPISTTLGYVPGVDIIAGDHQGAFLWQYHGFPVIDYSNPTAPIPAWVIALAKASRAPTAETAYKPPTHTVPEKWRKILNSIPHSCVTNFKTWLMIMDALHHDCGGEQWGADLFIEVCRTWPSWPDDDGVEVNDLWHRRRNPNKKLVTIGSVLALLPDGIKAARVREVNELDPTTVGFGGAVLPPGAFVSAGERDAAAAAVPTTPASYVGPKPGDGLRLLCAADIEPKDIDWIWPGYLVCGALQMLAGIAGTSKTTVALRFAATVSTGGTWPDGSKVEAGGVLMWTGEDSIEETLIPRLKAMSANLKNIYFVGDFVDGGKTRVFDPAMDMLQLDARARQIPNLRLIILDPIVSVVKGDSHKNAEVRRDMMPVIAMAKATGAALLGITHLTKNTSGGEPIERIVGSLAFGAITRIVYFATKYKDSATECHFIRIKSNIGPDGHGFRYDIKIVKDPTKPNDLGLATVEFGHPIFGRPRGLMQAAMPEAERKPTKKEKATEWLIEHLKDGKTRKREEIVNAAKLAGIAESTLEKAAVPINIEKSEKGGKQGSAKGTWRLSDKPFAPDPLPGTFVPSDDD